MCGRTALRAAQAVEAGKRCPCLPLTAVLPGMAGRPELVRVTKLYKMHNAGLAVKS